MNQIEINKIVTTKYSGEVQKVTEVWRIKLEDEEEVEYDYIQFTPSQMKELKEKINKLDI